jgi:hypothetical protein
MPFFFDLTLKKMNSRGRTELPFRYYPQGGNV